MNSKVITSDCVKHRYMSLRPKAVILQSLGGYAGGGLEDAGRIDKDLARFLLKNRLIIMPRKDGSLDFVSSDILTPESQL